MEFVSSAAQAGESWGIVSNGWSFRKNTGSLLVGVQFNFQTTRSIIYLKRDVGLSPGSVVGRRWESEHLESRLDIWVWIAWMSLEYNLSHCKVPWVLADWCVLGIEDREYNACRQMNPPWHPRTMACVGDQLLEVAQDATWVQGRMKQLCVVWKMDPEPFAGKRHDRGKTRILLLVAQGPYGG